MFRTTPNEIETKLKSLPRFRAANTRHSSVSRFVFKYAMMFFWSLTTSILICRRQDAGVFRLHSGKHCILKHVYQKYVLRMYVQYSTSVVTFKRGTNEIQ